MNGRTIKRMGISHRWLPLAAVLSLALGFASDANVARGERESSVNERFVRIVQHSRGSVLAIGSYRREDAPTARYFGSGFVVNDGHTVATNAHVVQAIRDASRLGDLRVFFPDQDKVDGWPATIVAEDTFHDVALLRFRGPALTPLPLAVGFQPQPGQSVGIIGYPIGMQLGVVPAIHRGAVSAVVPAVLPLPRGARMTPQLEAALRRPYDLYQLDMVVYPGNSGSPLIDAGNGQVIGIINKTLATRTREHMLSQPSGIAYAVPVQWIHELLVRSLLDAQRQREPVQPSTNSEEENEDG
jgi:serine protease Do